MTSDDREQLSVELCRKWPGKFLDTDLEYWCRELDHFNVAAVVQVVTAFKNQSRFVPKIHEIKERLRKTENPSVAHNAKLRGNFSDIIRQANPNLAHQSDAALIMRYWRREWCLYAKRVGESANEREQQLLKDRCRSVKLSCQRDLWGVDGFDKDAAMRTAVFVVEDQRSFEMAISDLGMVNAATGEVPEFA